MNVQAYRREVKWRKFKGTALMVVEKIAQAGFIAIMAISFLTLMAGFMLVFPD